MPRLVIKPPSGSSWEIKLRPGPNLIGRSLTNHCQILDPSVSGTHCQIFVSDTAAQIKDLGSTNGTFVKGQRVTEALLEPGCAIRLGDVELLFEAGSAVSVPADARVAAGEPDPSQSPGVQTLQDPDVTPPLAPPGGRRPLQHCRFHPALPARFVCVRCGHYFCEACVATRSTGAAQERFCRHCGAKCAEVRAQFEAATAKGFFECLPGALAYPLRGAGVLVVIVGIVLFGLVKAGQALFIYGTMRTIIFGVILEIFAGGYLFAYLQGIVHSSVAGDREMPDLPGIANFLEDVILPFFRFMGLTLLCFAPAIGAGIWLATSHNPQAAYVLAAAIVLAYLYFPMAFLAVATLDSVMAGNPLVVVPSIIKVPVKYLVALLPLAGMSALQWYGGRFLDRMFPEGWTTHAMGEFLAMIAVMAGLSFVSFYLLIISVHLLGLIFVTSKSNLGWLET